MLIGSVQEYMSLQRQLFTNLVTADSTSKRVLADALLTAYFGSQLKTFDTIHKEMVWHARVLRL